MPTNSWGEHSIGPEKLARPRQKSYKADFQPEPAKNVEELKISPPQVMTVKPEKIRLGTVDKRFEKDSKPGSPDGRRFGHLIGMERGQ